MKKYFINQFSISCFKKMSERPLDTQVIFKPYLPQVFRMIVKIYKRKYQLQNDHMKHHWIRRNVFLFYQRRENEVKAQRNKKSLAFRSQSHMTSSQYANHACLHRNQSLRVKQKNKEESRTQTGVNAVIASLWLLIQKACVVTTLTKFLKNCLMGKNALQNQPGSELHGLPGKTSITCFIISP